MIRELRKLKEEIVAKTGMFPNCWLFLRATWDQAQKDVHFNMYKRDKVAFPKLLPPTPPLDLNHDRFFGIEVFVADSKEEFIKLAHELKDKYKSVGVFSGDAEECRK